MATPLSRAHKVWRSKVFFATWLSYIGFYFCRRPFSAAKSAIGDETGWSATTLGNVWTAYLIAYAIGQFLASAMGTRLGPRRNVLLGMGLSIAVTLALGLTLNGPLMAGLVAVNGLAQATGWSGNVGTMAGWFHKHERGRVMGLWSTNFTIGALASGWVMGTLLGDGKPAPWRHCFYAGAAVLTVVWVQYFFLQRNKPEDVGLAPVDDPVTTDVDESITPEPPPPEAERVRGGVAAGGEGSEASARPTSIAFMGLSRTAWTNLLLVAGFYFFAKLIRYAMWSWAAFFLERNFEITGDDANKYSILFDLFGIPGVFLTGWISDRFFQSRRAGVSLASMICMMIVTALLVGFGDRSVTTFAILLAGVGITLYGPDALLSAAGAMDIGGRRSATFATAVISGFGSIGPIVQELVISRLYDAKTPVEKTTAMLQQFFHVTPPADPAQLRPIFILIFASATLATVFCALLVWRNRKGRGV